jgi:hypothetical protein
LLYSGRLLYKIEKEVRQKDRWALDAAVLEAKRYLEPLYAGLLELVTERPQLSNTNSGQRVSECRRVELGVAAAPPSGGQAHLLLTLRRLLTYHEEGAEGARHMGVRSPLTPTLSPLEKGGEGVGSGGM